MKNEMEFIGKKVLIIVENLPSPFDRRVWQEANALKEKGALVSIICPIGKGYEKRFEIVDDIHIYRHSLPIEAKGAWGYVFEYSAALFHEMRLALKVLKERGFDVIHACNPPDLIYLVALPFIKRGKKFIFDHHDINPELYLAKFGRKDFLYKMMCFFEKRTFQHAQLVISTNESYKKIAIERGNVPEKNIFVVRSGPSLDRLIKTDPNPIHKCNRKYLVGYVGVIGHQEGLCYLVEAAAHIVFTLGRKDIHFACVGDGTEKRKIMLYAKKLCVEEYFTFYGRVPDRVLVDVLNTSDICVNTDEMNEMNDKSTMNKIMEYMAIGKPIVQFDLTEGRFSAQEASLYAQPNCSTDLADKIIWLADHPEERARMGDYGYNRVRNVLEWQYEKENLFKAYRKIFFEL